MNPMTHWFDIQTPDGFGNALAAEVVSQQISEPESDYVRVREVMQTVANTIDAKASVMAAADRMWLSGADCLMVMEEDRCVGMITDRDLIVGCVSRHRRPTRTCVRDIMSAVSASCQTSQTIADALAVMNRSGASWLPVNDENGNVVGLVGRKNLDCRTTPLH